jgi:hypothetical protein
MSILGQILSTIILLSIRWAKMSNSPWNKWWDTAKEHLEKAITLYSIGEEEVAFEKAVYTGECALKAVLVKHGLFTSADYTHDQTRLLNKIQVNSLLSSSLFNQVKDIITESDGVDGLTRVSLQQGGSHMDCTADIPYVRYPYDDNTAYDMLKSGNALEKIQLAEKLINLLDGNF